jgi:hypothetical protein
MSHKKTLKETPEQLIQRILRQNKDMEEKVAKEAAQGSLKNDSNDVPVDKAPAKGVEEKAAKEAANGSYGDGVQTGDVPVDKALAAKEVPAIEVPARDQIEGEGTNDIENEKAPVYKPAAPKPEEEVEKPVKRKARIVKPVPGASTGPASPTRQAEGRRRRSTLYGHTKSSRKKMAYKLVDQYEKSMQIKDFNTTIAPTIKSKRMSIPREAQMRALQAAERETCTLQGTKRRLVGRLGSIQRELGSLSNQTKLICDKKKMLEKKSNRIRIAWDRDSNDYQTRSKLADRNVKGVQARLSQAAANHEMKLKEIEKLEADKILAMKQKIEELDLEIASHKVRNDEFMTDVQVKLAQVGKTQLVERNLAISLRVQKAQILGVLKTRGAAELHNSYVAAMTHLRKESGRVRQILRHTNEEKMRLNSSLHDERYDRNELLDALEDAVNEYYNTRKKQQLQ